MRTEEFVGISAFSAEKIASRGSFLIDQGHGSTAQAPNQANECLYRSCLFAVTRRKEVWRRGKVLDI